MDLRCSKCKKEGLTEDEEFKKANIDAISNGWAGCMEITMYCKHIADGWNFLEEESQTPLSNIGKGSKL